VNDRDLLLSAFAEQPQSDSIRLALADWYAEHGDELREQQCRTGPVPLSSFHLDMSGGSRGAGFRYGDAAGNGEGAGDEYNFYSGGGKGGGDGYALHFDDGGPYADRRGDGGANGFCDDPWYGSASGDGKGVGDYDWHMSLEGRVMPEVGKNQLIVLPHGWVICGFVEEQTGPFSFRVRDAHVICLTNGVPWDALADGRERDAPSYRRWGTVTIGPQFVMSREWVGELPLVTS
jgi:uncharacterized protein (TIGR02996 family)